MDLKLRREVGIGIRYLGLSENSSWRNGSRWVCLGRSCIGLKIEPERTSTWRDQKGSKDKSETPFGNPCLSFLCLTGLFFSSTRCSGSKFKSQEVTSGRVWEVTRKRTLRPQCQLGIQICYNPLPVYLAWGENEWWNHVPALGSRNSKSVTWTIDMKPTSESWYLLLLLQVSPLQFSLLDFVDYENICIKNCDLNVHTKEEPFALCFMIQQNWLWSSSPCTALCLKALFCFLCLTHS